MNATADTDNGKFAVEDQMLDGLLGAAKINTGVLNA